MRFVNHTATRVFAWQNFLAAAVFIALVSGDCVAYLLNIFPASDTLWRVVIPLQKLSRPFSDVLGEMTANNPAVPFLLLVSCLLLPLWAYRRRNLITTAALGHTALAGCVMMLFSCLGSANQTRSVANLSFVFDPDILSTSTVTLVLAAFAMLVLCGLNHVIYFRQFMLRDR